MELNRPRLIFSFIPTHTNIVQEIQEEGRHAIDSPGAPNQPEFPPEDYILREWIAFHRLYWAQNNWNYEIKIPGDNEQRAIIQPQSLNDPLVKELIGLLIDWINDELADERIIVKDIEEDLYDGQVLHKLWEKLTTRKLDVPEVTQSEEGQRQKMQIVLNAVNHVSTIVSNSLNHSDAYDSHALFSDFGLP